MIDLAEHGGEAVIASPNHPFPSYNGARCSWQIKASSPSQGLVFEFLEWTIIGYSEVIAATHIV